MKKRIFWKLLNKNAACHGLFRDGLGNRTCQKGKAGNKQRAPLSRCAKLEAFWQWEMESTLYDGMIVKADD